MNFKTNIIIAIVLIFTFSCKSIKTDSQSKDVVQVEYPEVYELANIILALTEYGKTDKWEVRQGFDYYNKVQEYFNPVSNHPLLDSVNYSRKRWEEYLSFRTDAYAFSFDQSNRLKRDVNFYTNEGVNPFDKHLDLINDFVEKSNFRIFFKQNKNYQDQVSEKYKETQYIKEIRDFLISEFGEQTSSLKKYKVVLSPFVYRMNCHRNIDSTLTADFITIPIHVLSDTISVKKKDQANTIHNLFTEMDHGYVNPATNNMNSFVSKSFNEAIWNNKSGYENNKNAVFNEYMTWAIYDIFLQKYFPQYTKELGLNWSFQNDTRGFQYAQLFTQKLLSLYNKRKVKIIDLYPEMLKWSSEIQNSLTKPKIVAVNDSLKFSKNTKISISFSEPMKTVSHFTIIKQEENKKLEIIEITTNENNLKWMENGKKLEFNLNLPKKDKSVFLNLNWWGTTNPLYSKKNILLRSNSSFKLTNNLVY